MNLDRRIDGMSSPGERAANALGNVTAGMLGCWGSAVIDDIALSALLLCLTTTTTPPSLARLPPQPLPPLLLGGVFHQFPGSLIDTDTPAAPVPTSTTTPASTPTTPASTPTTPCRSSRPLCLLLRSRTQATLTALIVVIVWDSYTGD